MGWSEKCVEKVISVISCCVSHRVLYYSGDMSSMVNTKCIQENNVNQVYNMIEIRNKKICEWRRVILASLAFTAFKKTDIKERDLDCNKMYQYPVPCSLSSIFQVCSSKRQPCPPCGGGKGSCDRTHFIWQTPKIWIESTVLVLHPSINLSYHNFWKYNIRVLHWEGFA